MSATLDALDRIDHITACLEAVSDLMIPASDLHAVDRGKQALLLAFLLTEYRIASDNLGQALKPGKVNVLHSAA